MIMLGINAAVEAFHASPPDALVIGPFILEK